MALVFENKVKENAPVFIAKVKDISARLGINPNWLMAVMYNESGINHRIQNTKYPMQGGYATGLIQFAPNTARGLGTTTDELRAMTNVQQLDYVYKYFRPYKSRIKSFVDLYLVTFFPAVLGKPRHTVIESKNIPARAVALSNWPFDLNRDQKITVGELEDFLAKRFPADVWEILKKKECQS